MWSVVVSFKCCADGGSPCQFRRVYMKIRAYRGEEKEGMSFYSKVTSS
jgi:hypothetical protein